MREACQTLSILEGIIAWVQLICQDAHIRRFFDGHFSDQSTIETGVRQGGPMKRQRSTAVIEEVFSLLDSDDEI